MFPSGTAGFGLFVLRITVTAAFVFGALARGTLVNSVWTSLVIGVTALFLCAGLLTPYCAASCVVLQAVFLLHHHSSEGVLWGVNMLNSLTLALLGPGAYSIDAVLFGRRRLILPYVDNRGNNNLG